MNQVETKHEYVPDKDEIYHARMVMNWSQETLAQKVGVSFVTINRWENDKSKASGAAALRKLNQIIRIARRKEARAKALQGR